MESTRTIYEDHNFGIVIQIYVTSYHFDSDTYYPHSLYPSLVVWALVHSYVYNRCNYKFC